ncbi:hypothetical protein TNCV_2122281 [Trichonephila clavipes]|nr:hypothetical protein TNCV_2122281 [Trichonephila clavipes]
MPRLNKRNYDYTRKCTFFLSKNPDTSAEVLHSETFETEDLDGTRWQLVFYTKGHSFRNYTSLYLQRASCDTNIEKIFVDFSFECERNRTYVEFQNICFDRHHCWGSPVFSQIPSRKTDNTFEIFIRMSKSKVLSEIDVQNLKNDLEALSQDLLDILQYGQLSDLRLSCVRNQFLTHKCILAARCPKLVSIGMENISLEILRVILVYIYSAKLIIPNVRISAELYIVTMKLEMTDLIQKMHNHPYFSSLDPEFNVDHLKFDWEVNSELLKTQPCSRTYPTKKIYTNKLIIACEIKKDNDDFYLFVSFHFDTFNTDMPIFLDYRIEESSCGRVTLLGCESHMFFKNEIWESRINKNFCKLPKVFQLICHIDLFDEVKFISNHRDRIIHVKTAQNYSYYNRFPVDMLRFLKSEFLSDFTMISTTKKNLKYTEQYWQPDLQSSSECLTTPSKKQSQDEWKLMTLIQPLYS